MEVSVNLTSFRADKLNFRSLAVCLAPTKPIFYVFLKAKRMIGVSIINNQQQLKLNLSIAMRHITLETGLNHSIITINIF